LVRPILFDMIDVTRVSSRGQVVIPKPIRDRLGLKEGDRLIAFARDGLVILRRYEEESVLHLLSKRVRGEMAEREIEEKDVDEAIEWARRQA